MAFIGGIGNDRVATPPRTEEGRRGVVFPILADESQALNVTLSGCKTCSKRVAHGSPCCQMARKVNAGQHPLDGIAEEQIFQPEFLHRLVIANWVAGYALNGLPTWRPWNLGAGTANNLTQQTLYEILAILGARRLRLKGWNPKRIVTGVSNRNPEWPLEAPSSMRPPWMSDEEWNGTPTAVPPYSDGAKYAALIPSQKPHSLPLGSLAAFAHPSVLAQKLTPYVTKIYPPETNELEDVEFEVELSHSVTSAMTPYDLAYPPSDGKYYVAFHYFAVSPEAWPNFQELEAAWFTRRTITITAAALAEDEGLVALNDSEGYGARVLFPSMGTNVLSVAYRREAAAPVTLSDAVVTAALTTTDLGTSWATTLDLSELLAFADLVDVTITFMPEAVDGDEPIVPCQGSCSNSQRDYTGSYVHGTSKRCMNIGCSKFQAGGYRDTCWDPEASGFVRGYGTGGFPITNPRESNWLARMWSECSFRKDQGIEGLNAGRNFWYTRVGLPSLQEYVGGFSDTVPQGKFARRETLFTATMGQRRVYTDSLGDIQHELIHGLFFPRTFRDAVNLGFEGALRAIVAGWESRLGQRRQAMDEVGKDFPRWGPAGLRLYEYTGLTNGLSFGKRISLEPRQTFITGQVLSAVDEDLAAEVRNLI